MYSSLDNGSSNRSCLNNECFNVLGETGDAAASVSGALSVELVSLYICGWVRVRHGRPPSPDPRF